MSDVCETCGGRADTNPLSRVRWCLDCHTILDANPRATQGARVATFIRPAHPTDPEPPTVPHDFLPGKKALVSALATFGLLEAPGQDRTSAGPA